MVSNPDKHPPKAVNYNVACIIHDGQSAQLLSPPLLLTHTQSISMIIARSHQVCAAMG